MTATPFIPAPAARCVAGVLVVLMLVAGSVGARTARADDGLGEGEAPRALAQCDASRLSVVMVVDESGSLTKGGPENRGSDSEDHRIEGLKGALYGLADLTGPFNQRAIKDVEVRFVGFSRDLDPNAPGGAAWLDLSSPAGVDGAVSAASGFATRDGASGTDFGLALDQARTLLRERAEAYPGSCQAVVMFTDGQVDVGSASEDERILRKLCTDTVPSLAANPPVLRFMIGLGANPDALKTLRALAIGGDGGADQSDCGGARTQTRASGYFTSTSSGADLYRRFTGALTGQLPPEVTGDRSFKVYEGIERVVIAARLARRGDSVTIATPQGVPETFDRVTDRDTRQLQTADATMTARWISPTLVRIQIDFTGSRGQGKRWGVRFAGPRAQQSTSTVRMLAGVRLDVDAPAAFTTVPAEAGGRPPAGDQAPARNTVVYRLTYARGTALPADSELARRSSTEVALQQSGNPYPASLSAAEPLPGYPGGSRLRLAPPDSWSQGRARLTVVTSFDVGDDVVVAQLVQGREVQIRGPAGQGFPTVGTDVQPLDLGTLEGTETGKAGFVVRASPDRAGCVWAPADAVAPEDVEVGTQPRLPTTQSGCLKIPAGTSRTLYLTVKSTTSDADRRVNVELPLLLNGSPPNARSVEPRKARIEATAQLLPHQQTWWSVLLSVLLVAVGLGIPLALLAVLNRRDAVFHRVDRLRVHSIDLRFDAKGRILDRDAVEQIERTERLPRLASEASTRIIELDGLVLEATAPFARVFIGPIARLRSAETEPVTLIAAGQRGGLQTGWGPAHQLGLALEQTWILVHEDVPVRRRRSEAGAEQEARRGRLHLVVRELRDDDARRFLGRALSSVERLGAPPAPEDPPDPLDPDGGTGEDPPRPSGIRGRLAARRSRRAADDARHIDEPGSNGTTTDGQEPDPPVRQGPRQW